MIFDTSLCAVAYVEIYMSAVRVKTPNPWILLNLRSRWSEMVCSDLLEASLLGTPVHLHVQGIMNGIMSQKIMQI